MTDALGGIAFCFLALVVIVAAMNADRKRRHTQAQRDAHGYSPRNVHGNAGYASKKDAQRKGWI